MLAQIDGENLAEQAEAWGPVVTPYLPYVVGGAIFLVALVVLLKLLRRGDRGSAAPANEPQLIQRLPTGGPPPTGPCVELYNVPMRLAVVVVAPVGRGGQSPSAAQVPGIVESVIPGMKQVISAHEPLVRTMPPQLSAKGFAHLVFAKLKLPGVDADGDTDAQGKGTPWSMVAGKMDPGGDKLMVALVLSADSTNGIGGVMLENENQWLDVLKIRNRA